MFAAGITSEVGGVDVGDGCGDVSGDCAGVAVTLQLEALNVESKNIPINKYDNFFETIIQTELAFIKTK